MSEDRYERIARASRYFGWLQDLVLRQARTHIVDIFRAKQAASVLDAACGAGTLSKYLKKSELDVTGVDSSRAMLTLARNKVHDVSFIEGDMTEVSLPQKVDGAVVALSLHEMNVEARTAFWKSMRESTSSGGTLVLLDFIPLEKPNSFSRQVQHILWKDEKNIGNFDPDHFHNFQEFMHGGGAKSWLLNQNEYIMQERHFLFGNLGVFVVNA